MLSSRTDLGGNLLLFLRLRLLLLPLPLLFLLSVVIVSQLRRLGVGFELIASGATASGAGSITTAAAGNAACFLSFDFLKVWERQARATAILLLT